MQLIFLMKSDCLGCAVLLCLFVCLTLLASSFLLFSSLIKICIYMYSVDLTIRHSVHCVYESRELRAGQYADSA